MNTDGPHAPHRSEPPRPLRSDPASTALPSSPAAGMLIGISGAPESTRGTGSDRAVARCRELGLDALEMAWVHRVSIKPDGARRIRDAALSHAIRLSVHAPYYVNLNSRDPDRLAASVERIVASARGAAWAGASDVVVHTAFLHGDAPSDVGARVAERLGSVRARLDDEGLDVTIRPEVMGGRGEFGDLPDILALCRSVRGLAPCIDVAHLHARRGGGSAAADFEALWDEVGAALGDAALRSAHIHLSGIAYGPSGETRHLPLEESDLDFRRFLAVTHDRGIRGTIVVESPARERDALLVRDVWRSLTAQRRPARPPRRAASRTPPRP